MTPRQEAIARGAKRYNGKICPKHPDLGGERFVCNTHCTKCDRLRNLVANLTPEQIDCVRKSKRKHDHKRWDASPQYRMEHTNDGARRRRAQRIAQLEQEADAAWAT